MHEHSSTIKMHVNNTHTHYMSPICITHHHTSLWRQHMQLMHNHTQLPINAQLIVIAGAGVTTLPPNIKFVLKLWIIAGTFSLPSLIHHREVDFHNSNPIKRYHFECNSTHWLLVLHADSVQHISTPICHHWHRNFKCPYSQLSRNPADNKYHGI